MKTEKNEEKKEERKQHYLSSSDAEISNKSSNKEGNLIHFHLNEIEEIISVNQRFVLQMSNTISVTLR